MRSATESELLQDLQADRCREGKAQLAAQYGRNDYTTAEMSITHCCPQLLTLVMMTC